MWPERLIALSSRWKMENHQGRERALGQMWIIINEAISVNLWKFANGNADLGPEDVYDIAAEKAYELLELLNNGGWNLDDTSPARVTSFIATVARNALIDYTRTTGKKRRRSVDIASMGGDERGPGGRRAAPASEPVDATADRLQFVSALHDCVAALQPRTQALWLMRVLLGMPSKDIARHPDIEMTPAAVDVALGRCRNAIRDCMKGKGFEPHELPPGTAAALWEAFRNEMGER